MRAGEETLLENSKRQREKKRANLCKQLGEKIEERRKEMGFSRRQLAILIDVSEDRLERIENGSKNLNIKQMIRLALVLRCELEITFKPAPT